MSQKALSMKAFSLGQDAGNLVSTWKQEWEHTIEKEKCLKLLADHLHAVNFIPKQPSIGMVKQYLSESCHSIADEIGLSSIAMEEHSDVQISDCASTLDLNSLTLCCYSDPNTVLDITCATLVEKGTMSTVVLNV